MGANVNGVTAASTEVEPAPFGVYTLYTLTFTANAGDVIRVWMYSPPRRLRRHRRCQPGNGRRVGARGDWRNVDNQGVGEPFGSFDLTGADFSVQGTYKYGEVSRSLCAAAVAPGAPFFCGRLLRMQHRPTS